MKNLITAILLASVSVSACAAEAEQDKYTLTCKAGETAFEKELTKPLYSFTIDPFSKVNVEVTAKNGASLTVATTTSSSSVSFIQIGGSSEPQKVQLDVDTGSKGEFAVKVELPKLRINGQNPAAGQAYGLKVKCLSKEIPDDVI